MFTKKTSEIRVILNEILNSRVKKYFEHVYGSASKITKTNNLALFFPLKSTFFYLMTHFFNIYNI